MSTRYEAAVDAGGWVGPLFLREGPTPETPAMDRVPLTTEEYLAAEGLPLHHGPDGLELPRDDRQAWRRLRALGGRTGAEAMVALRKVHDAYGRFPRDWSTLAPLPPPRMAPGAPSGPLFPGVAGLTLEPLTADHLDAMAAIAIASGLQPATCPDGTCQPPDAHAWLQLAARIDHDDGWQHVLAFQGRPLQYETLTFSPDRARAVFTITYHETRERPSWFWRECERPMFEALGQVGVEALTSRTRADRPDWIASLKANYGATEIGPAGPHIMRLQFPLSLASFQGWPARRQVGHDQTTGRVRTWEATAAELPAVRTLITDTVPVGQRAIALRVLDEWFHLDRATLVLGALDGALRYARTIRHRKPGQASLAIVGALFDEPAQSTVTTHLRTWFQQAGYTTVSSFVPERLMASPNMQAQLARAGTRIVRTRTDLKETFVEMEMDV